MDILSTSQNPVDREIDKHANQLFPLSLNKCPACKPWPYKRCMFFRFKIYYIKKFHNSIELTAVCWFVQNIVFPLSLNKCPARKPSLTKDACFFVTKSKFFSQSNRTHCHLVTCEKDRFFFNETNTIFKGLGLRTGHLFRNWRSKNNIKNNIKEDTFDALLTRIELRKLFFQYPFLKNAIHPTLQTQSKSKSTHTQKKNPKNQKLSKFKTLTIFWSFEIWDATVKANAEATARREM